MNKTVTTLIALVLSTVMFLAISLVTSFIVKICWNYGIAPALHTPELSYEQAIFLYVFCRIVTGNHNIKIATKEK